MINKIKKLLDNSNGRDRHKSVPPKPAPPAPQPPSTRGLSPIKRYALFGDSRANFSPRGGWEDVEGASNNIEELVQLGNKLHWWHIVDLTTGEIIKKSDEDY